MTDIDPVETQEWREGFDAQREAWEADYAKAHERWEAHKAFVAKQDAQAAEAEVAAPAAPRKRGAKGDDTVTSYSSHDESEGGTLASDERLAALREKLTGN